MKVDHKGNTTIIKDTQNDLGAFVHKITKDYHVFQNQNIILDLSHTKSLTIAELDLFKDLVESHKIGNKSIIIVSDVIDFNKVPNSLLVVPSVLEAHDMIEMDEIERDLGF